MKKMKRYAEGDLVDHDIETTTDEEGNEVTIARKGYSPKMSMPAPAARPARMAPTTAPRTRSMQPTATAAPKVSARQAAARSKYIEARGYDEASQNPNLSNEDRRAMLGRYAQAMKEYDALGRALNMKRGGAVKRYASGGSVKPSASKRADGVAQRGKTKGRYL